MTAITSSSHVTPTSYLDPCAQIQQFCGAMGSLFGSVLESTDSAFRRVHLVKRDADGNIKIYDKKEKVIDPDTGNEVVVTKKDAIVTYIEEVKTGTLYVDDSSSVVAVKCAGIALAMPFYTLGRMCWAAVKTPLEIGVLALDAIVNVGKLFVESKYCEAAEELRRSFIQILQVSGNGLFEIVKAPLFGLGCELAVLYGIFKPYHGRKIEGLIENAWQAGISYKEDLRKTPHDQGEDCWTAFVKDMQAARPFYFATCGQSRGNVNEARIIVIRREGHSFTSGSSS